jgi:hypothetical protein
MKLTGGYRVVINGEVVGISPTQETNKITSTVLGFFAGLAAKDGLDALCKSITDSTGSLPSVLEKIGTIPAILFLVFFLTIVRFLYGALRFQEEAGQNDSSLVALWN